MKIFHLPDLGEGLAEAEIREWHVQEGEFIQVDQPLVSMETAKAVVDVPSPQTGKVMKLYGKKGDVVPTHAPLVEFADEHSTVNDQGTVVGTLEQSNQVLNESNVVIGSTKNDASTVKAMPAVRKLAKALNVELTSIKPSGKNNQITEQDVKNAAKTVNTTVEPLHGVRRAMAIAMTESHQQVVPVTLMDEAEITHFNKVDYTVCILKSLVAAVASEPALNAWYDHKKMERHLYQEVNVGLAMDTEEGLFVPVIKQVANKTDQMLREEINLLKQSVKARTVPLSDLQGATILLSNFGTIAGQYANPIIVPPTVAILGCGQVRQQPIVKNNQIVAAEILPLSLTFDHRAVTGGEATRFLAALIKYLSLPQSKD